MQPEVIIIGAGPAGLAAAAYTQRYHLSTLVIASDLGGAARYRLQLPWMEGREVIFGEDLVEQLRRELLTAPQVQRHTDVVEQVSVQDDMFHVVTRGEQVFQARAVIVATGVTPRILNVPGEQRLMGYGVTYSATSHAPLFIGRRVVVVGSDLRALRAAVELSALAAHVTLVVPDETNPGSYAQGRRLLQHERVTVLRGRTVREIMGDKAVTAVVLSGPDGVPETVPADGVFVEMGLVVQTGFLGNLAERTPNGRIVVDDRGATRCPGLFAAGDITSAGHAEQIVVALGEGAKAGLSVCTYLLER